MGPDEYCGECGEGILYGYKTICEKCKQKPCEHDWEEFKGDGYRADVYVCRVCAERRSVTGQRLGPRRQV